MESHSRRDQEWEHHCRLDREREVGGAPIVSIYCIPTEKVGDPIAFGRGEGRENYGRGVTHSSRPFDGTQ